MDRDSSSDIAVVAMAGRFPGANDLEQFWELLRDGAEGLTRFEGSELVAAGERPDLLQRSDYVKVRGVMQGEDLFDAAFFDVSPAEAEYTDPQHRIFLEYCFTALQVAGYDPNRFDGLIGVYAGAANSAYLQSNVMPNIDCTSTSKCMQVLAGNDKDFLATRVSYKLNLKGPSYTIQTACSTSLVAIHMACQALLSGECDLALAGGVTIRVPQTRGYIYEEGGLVSKDGHVRPFDADASGTVPSNGVGVVVLKLLENALATGDTILAVVKGTATNNDGSSKANYAAPGKAGQAAVIREAHAVSRVPAGTIGYVEAQGSATKLGDTLEVAALTEAFRKQTSARGFCALGSVKSNLGALDAAAGVASFAKTVLMLQRRALVPTANYFRPNPNIDFATSPFFVSTKLCDWLPVDGPRRAAVSSFGLGGTNAHVVLEEAPVLPPSGAARPEQLLVLSAKSRSALDRMSRELAERLRADETLALADVAFTLAVGRPAFRHRRALSCGDREAALELLVQTAAPGDCVDTEPRSIAFAFETDVPNAARLSQELVASEPEFKLHFDACVEAGLRATRQLDATFMHQYALAKLWLHWGIEPVLLLTQGCGGAIAACLAGTLDLAAAVGALETFGAGCELPKLKDQGRYTIESYQEGSALAAKRLVLNAALDSNSAVLQRAWLAGASIDWPRYYAGQRRYRVPLPSYPFERKRYWMAEAAVPTAATDAKLREGAAYILRADSERLALALAEHIAQRTKVHLVLVGEAGLSRPGRGRLEAIRASGSSVRYTYARQQSLLEDLRRIAARIRDERLELAAVLDTTELLQDSWTTTQSDQELETMAPALLTVLWPGAVTRALELDPIQDKPHQATKPLNLTLERREPRESAFSEHAK